MKLILEVKDKKAAFVKELLEHFSFVKVKEEVIPEHEEILKHVREAVEEYKLVRAGKLKARPARELLDEL